MLTATQEVITDSGVTVTYFRLAEFQYIGETGETSMVAEGWISEAAYTAGKKPIWRKSLLAPAGVNPELLQSIMAWAVPYAQTNFEPFKPV